MEWNQYFFTEGYLSARKSKDRRTQVGAVIVDSHNNIRVKGYNGLCRGEDDARDEFHVQPLKGDLHEHAERNALYTAARFGIAVDGLTMFVTLAPCFSCARAIIQSGIKKLVLHTARDIPERGVLDLLDRRGVTVEWWDGVPLISGIMIDGLLINDCSEPAGASVGSFEGNNGQ